MDYEKFWLLLHLCTQVQVHHCTNAPVYIYTYVHRYIHTYVDTYVDTYLMYMAAPLGGQAYRATGSAEIASGRVPGNTRVAGATRRSCAQRRSRFGVGADRKRRQRQIIRCSHGFVRNRQPGAARMRRAGAAGHPSRAASTLNSAGSGKML